jgi:hypothetical protein
LAPACAYRRSQPLKERRHDRADRLGGGAGNDRLTGGKGRDRATGCETKRNLP